jgi:tetratricopeptide (TPR) repeat protein
MDWSEWVELSPDEFSARLTPEIYATTTASDWIDLYNALIVRAAGDAIRIAKIAQATAEALRAHDNAFGSLLFWELLARTSFETGSLEQCVTALNQMIELDTSEESKDEILELARAVGRDADNFGSSLDQRPRVYAAVMEILEHYGLREEIARLHLEAAALYSRHGASQAAYRSIVDAEHIAHELEEPRLLADVYGIAVSTAIEETDHEWAIGTGDSALAVWQSLGKDPPSSLLSNLGVAHMRVGNFPKGAAHMRAALAASDNPVLSSAIRINLAACLRSAGEVEEAWDVVLQAEEILAEDNDPERRLEFALIAARIAAERESGADLARLLNDAARHLDYALKDILRLHHRRGVRERFVPRIEGLLGAIPAEGSSEDILSSIISIRANALGDWLSILDWSVAIETNEVGGDDDRKAISSCLLRLRSFGAPHLFGYREKYDDAWNPMPGGNLWDELSAIAAPLERAGVPLPTSSMNLDAKLNLCRARLDEGHAIVAFTHVEEDVILWCLMRERYRSARIPRESFQNWRRAVLGHAAAAIDRTAFDREIRDLFDAIWAVAEPIFNDIADQELSSIRYLQDFSDSLPITGLALRHPKLAERMAKGDFQVRIVPALYAGAEAPLNHPSIVSIVSEADALLLSSCEAPCFAHAIAEASFEALSADPENAQSPAMRDADVILVSTHSSPLAFYTDAYFAKMGSPDGRHPISVERLQRFAPDMNAALVLLNACHSGAGVARNFQQIFRTSDLVTFPALFTLNRRAIVSAGAWKMSDTVSFLHSQLVADALAEGHLPAAALASSIARLPRMSRDEAITYLDRIENVSVRKQSAERLANAPLQGLFSAPYVSGGLAVHGLL